MVDPIEGLNKIVANTTPLATSKNVRIGSSGSRLEEVDTVDFNAESLVDVVREQVSTLKRELPAMIAGALLAPIENQAARNLPLNSLLFKLTNPLEGVLGALPRTDITEELVQKLREELNNFKNALPALTDEAVLAQFSGQSPSNPLNEILASLSNRISGVTQQLDRLL